MKDAITREIHVSPERIMVCTTDKRISFKRQSVIMNFRSRFKYVNQVTTLSTT